MHNILLKFESDLENFLVTYSNITTLQISDQPMFGLETLFVSTHTNPELDLTISTAPSPPIIRDLFNPRLQAWGRGLGEKLRYQWD